MPFWSQAFKICWFSAALLVGAAPVGAHSFAQTTDLTVQSQLVDGLLRWTPGTIRIQNGAAVNLTVVNQLKEAESFAIPGLVDAVVIPAGGSHVFSFDANISGTYPFKSADHPAAQPAKLVILR